MSASVNIQVQGSRVTISHKDNLPSRDNSSNGAKRGRVSSFSKRSRKRLLDMAASLQLDASTMVIFLTLTYGQVWPDGRTMKRHLDNFKKRLVRFAPTASAIWKLEFQKRGAPHFHFIIFGLPFIDKYDVARMWGEVIGEEYWNTANIKPVPPFTRIEQIKEPKKAFLYVSKYVAKLDSLDCEPSSDEDAHHSVFSEDAPAVESGFNYVPYFTADDWTGRFWGVMNRKYLPFAAVFETESECDEVVYRAFFNFRRLMAKKWSAANQFGKHRGATIYVWDNSDCWIDAWLQCLLDAVEQVE